MLGVPEHVSLLNDGIFHSFLPLQEAPFCPTTMIYSIWSWRPSSSVNVAGNFSKKKESTFSTQVKTAITGCGRAHRVGGFWWVGQEADRPTGEIGPLAISLAGVPHTVPYGVMVHDAFPPFPPTKI